MNDDASQALTGLLGDVQEANLYHEAFSLLFKLVHDRPMPDEIASRVFKLCDGDMDDVKRTLAALSDASKTFEKAMYIRAVIESRKGARNGPKAK